MQHILELKTIPCGHLKLYLNVFFLVMSSVWSLVFLSEQQESNFPGA